MALTPREVRAQWGWVPTRGPVLVSGSKVYASGPDRRAFYGGEVVGVDMLEGIGVDLVHDLSLPLSRTFAHVDCHSVLEHCADPFAVARTLSDCLQPGGSLLLSVPFCWRPHAYPSDYWRFTVEGVKRLFPAIRWERLQYQYDGTLQDAFGISKAEKVGNVEKGEVRLPRAEVVGWGVKC